MSKTPSFERWGAQRLTMAEVSDQLAGLIGLLDQCLQMSVTLDPGLAARYETEARQLRELRWLLDPSDNVWLLVEPPDDPEFIEGSTYLVVIRHGKLLLKQRLIAA